MGSFGAALLFLVATAFGNVVLVGSGLAVKGLLLRLPMAFLFGHMLTAMTVFVFAWFLSFFGHLSLSSIVIAVLVAELLFIQRSARSFWTNRSVFWHCLIQREQLVAFALVIVSVLISYRLLIVHLQMVGSKIFRSVIYWDLPMHIGRIMSFAVADNVPPQDPHFAGAPLVYHFFYHFLEALYVAIGLNVVDAINFVSITSFAGLMVILLGFSSRYLGSIRVGMLAVYFTLIVSSLRFIRDIFCCERSFSELLSYWLIEEHHPYRHSLWLDFFEYNGGMFNFFYFIVERRLIFGILLMLSTAVVVLLRGRLTKSWMVFWSCLISTSFFWHFHVLTIVLTAVIAVIFFERDLRKDIWFIVPLLFLFMMEALLVRYITASNQVYVQEINSFPKLGYGFAAKGADSIFKWQIAWYYGINYGLKLIFIVLGYYVLWFKDRSIFRLLLFLGSGFVFTNVIHLSPGSIYENHKWLRISNVAFDLVASVGFFVFFDRIWGYLRRRICSPLLSPLIGSMFVIPIMLVLSLSGVTELLPFIRSEAGIFHADFNSPLVRFISSTVPADAVFLTGRWPEVHLAGRKVYLAGRVHGALGLNRHLRQAGIAKLSSYPSLKEACLFLKVEGIDYVDISKEDNWNWADKAYDSNAIIKLSDGTVLFDTQKGCQLE